MKMLGRERRGGAGAARMSQEWPRAGGVTVLASFLVACTTVRSDLCATVHSRMLEEQRTTDETPRHVLDPRACELHARRLRRLAADLSGLDISDAGLRKAVEGYRSQLEALAATYERLAKVHPAHQEADAAREALGDDLIRQASGLNTPRAVLQDACGGF